MRFFGSAPAPGAAPSSPSPTIMLLSALTASYLGVAVYYAALHALEQGEAPLWAIAAAALAVIAVASQLPWRRGGVAMVLSVSFVAQLAWAGWVDPQPLGDIGSFWIEARGVAANLRAGDIERTLLQLHASPQPSATFVYGLSVFAFGENLSTLRALTAGVWVVQTYLVWRIASEVSELKTRAFACALVFGLSPSLIVFGGLPSVEALFGLFALGAVYVMLSHRRRGLWQSASLSGTLVGLAYLSQPAGVGYLFGLLGVLVAGFAAASGPLQRGRMTAALLACLLGFAIGVAPQAALNYAVEQRWSIAPGAAIGLGLLRGSDPDGRGAQTLQEAAPLIRAEAAQSGAQYPEAEELRLVDLAAREIAGRRIAEDPSGFALYAATEKMQALWSSEQSVLEWSFKTPNAERNPLLQTEIGQLAPSIVGGAYLALLIAAAAGALRLLMRRGAVRDPTRWVLFYVAFLSIATAFAFFEVVERRHLAFTPLLALLAPLPFARLPQVEDRSFRGRLAAAAAELDRKEGGQAAGRHGDAQPAGASPIAAASLGPITGGGALTGAAGVKTPSAADAATSGAPGAPTPAIARAPATPAEAPAPSPTATARLSEPTAPRPATPPRPARRKTGTPSLATDVVPPPPSQTDMARAATPNAPNSAPASKPIVRAKADALRTDAAKPSGADPRSGAERIESDGPLQKGGPRRLPLAPRKPTAPKPAAASAPPGSSAAAPASAESAEAKPEKPVSDWSVDQKLAHVLRSMSKPPRPKTDDGSDGGPVGEGA
ncbi:MAG: hypothetical protein AAGM38_10720 [Pseudomonadota bacterium]